MTRFLSAEELYNEVVDFVNPDDWFNERAPDPYITLSIAAFLLSISFIWWMKRFRKLLETAKKFMTKKGDGNVDLNLKVRILISAAIENDNDLFSILTYTAVSFLVLFGIQQDYTLTWTLMIIFYFLVSSLESIRVVLAYLSVHYNAKGHGELVFSSENMYEQFSKMSKDQVLKPKNVYENLGREYYLVFMIFITQVVLITFVCIDISNTSTHTCIDGTKNCPVGGTLGSWTLFVFGIFMANVFLHGPKTNFGDSEQNPTYWLRLFLAIKPHSTEITWTDGRKGDKACSVTLNPADFRVQIRFLMSFLINGVGFHLLVHALPLQIASQSSLTSVVLRAVGMMYLVDLDDTPGYELTISKATEIECASPTKPRDESLVIQQSSRLLNGAVVEANDGHDEGQSHDNVRGLGLAVLH